MKQLFPLLFITFFSANAADMSASELAFDKETVLHIKSRSVARGYYIFTLLLEKEGRELGSLQFKFFDVLRSPKKAQIDFIIIAEEERNQGKGDWLLKKTLDIMKELRCVEVEAGVHDGNEPSLRLFKRNGFIIDGEAVPHAFGGLQIPLKKQL